MAWKSKWNNHTHMNFTSQAKYILGFNEPDQAEQANMTPETVAGLWPDIERNSNGRPLVSPAPAHHDFKWLDEFFRLCNNCRVDYIAAHAYNCDANHIMTYLQRMHNRYHKKIWLTEYSWFMARMLRIFGGGFMDPSAALLHNETSTLTRLGHFYNNFQPSDHASIVG
ncbi:ASL1-like protein [Mya arenaria]|uniref:ASL1-like protein n=1 Tax=Mya arenaria TaxID=6604 RepID=A0ABY7G347_MYAAR|nr:ASL1-like protein [Mya arenaria]